MQKQQHENDLSSLVQDARDLVAATADVAGDKVVDARKRLASALDSSQQMLGRASQRAVEQAKAADRLVRNNPYQVVAVALGIGALIGYLAARRSQRED